MYIDVSIYSLVQYQCQNHSITEIEVSVAIINFKSLRKTVMAIKTIKIER